MACPGAGHAPCGDAGAALLQNDCGVSRRGVHSVDLLALQVTLEQPELCLSTMPTPARHGRGERQLISTAFSDGRFKAMSSAVRPSSRDPLLTHDPMDCPPDSSHWGFAQTDDSIRVSCRPCDADRASYRRTHAHVRSGASTSAKRRELTLASNDSTVIRNQRLFAATSSDTRAATSSSISVQKGLLRSRVSDPNESVIAPLSPRSSHEPMLGMPSRPLPRTKP
jgi:hypothetical protein